MLTVASGPFYYSNKVTRSISQRTIITLMNNKDNIIKIDGSYGEGGGQILRNSFSLACILKKSIALDNIRANRKPKPGLKAQHMTGILLCVDISVGNRYGLKGCQLESPQLSYYQPPENNCVEVDTVIGDTQTAGSICLLLQAALPVALFARSTPLKLVLKGGTNATFAPQYDYWAQVFLPTFQEQFLKNYKENNDDNKDGGQIQPTVIRRGYFPRGGGHVEVQIHPLQGTICPVKLVQRGEVQQIDIRSYYAGTITPSMAQEMTEAALDELRQQIPSSIQIKLNTVHETNVLDSGYGILLVAKTTTGCRLAGSALGTISNYRKRKKAKEQQPSHLGRAAAQELLKTLQDGGCVDEWLQDQLIIFMALAEGESEVLTGCLTLHTQTAIWVAETLTNAKFDVTRLDSSGKEATTTTRYGQDGRISGKHLIRCTGIRFTNPKLHEKKGKE